jgi:hypothetical protein
MGLSDSASQLGINRLRPFTLAMNRDKRLTRPTGLTPKRRNMDEHALIGPSEPSGGKWITVNDMGGVRTGELVFH